MHGWLGGSEAEDAALDRAAKPFQVLACSAVQHLSRISSPALLTGWRDQPVLSMHRHRRVRHVPGRGI